MQRPWTFTVLIFSAFWVLYNAVFSGTILYFDAIGYEHAAEGLLRDGFGPYLSNGPNREPLYALFVALIMKAAGYLGVPYLGLLLLVQGLLLLLTQWMLACLFERIKLADVVSAILAAYTVISPTLLRSSLIEYSEIITYPLMLLPCVTAAACWQEAGNQRFTRQAQAWQGVKTGVSFIPVVFVKAIMEVIVPGVIIVLALLRLAVRDKVNVAAGRLVIFTAATLATFLLPVYAYKTLNYACNGNFTFTNRGSGALYGSMARKALPATPAEDLAQKLYVFPDKSICDARAGAQACSRWFYHLSDQLAADKYLEWKKHGLSERGIDSRFNIEAFKVIAAHPLRIFKGMFWEGAKLLFWEYPSWGMVVLPRAVRHFYEQPWLSAVFLWGVNGFNVVMVIAAIFYLLFNLRQRKRAVDALDGLFIVTLAVIIMYILAHSFFFLNERNALPIVPLFLLLYGSLAACLMRKKAA